MLQNKVPGAEGNAERLKGSTSITRSNNVITKNNEYLAALKNEHGNLVLTHRRKTFVAESELELVMAAARTRKLSDELLSHHKFSQYHLEYCVWKPDNCPCELCKTYIKGLGYTVLSE